MRFPIVRTVKSLIPISVCFVSKFIWKNGCWNWTYGSQNGICSPNFWSAFVWWLLLCIVKYFFRSLSENKSISRYQPKIIQSEPLFFTKQRKPIVPGKKELSENISSRSAKLRFVIKKKNFYNFDTDVFEKFKSLIEVENISNKLWKKL